MSGNAKAAGGEATLRSCEAVRTVAGLAGGITLVCAGTLVVTILRDDIFSGRGFDASRYATFAWPIREELAWVFANSNRPVVVIDDFDTKSGVDFDSFQGRTLDIDLVAPLVPKDYKFFYSGRTNRNRGMVFLIPPIASCGCPIGDRNSYQHARDSLWP